MGTGRNDLYRLLDAHGYENHRDEVDLCLRVARAAFVPVVRILRDRDLRDRRAEQRSVWPLDSSERQTNALQGATNGLMRRV